MPPRTPPRRGGTDGTGVGGAGLAAATMLSGMIDMAEFNDRSGQALQARTRRELAPVTADLPAGDAQMGSAGLGFTRAQAGHQKPRRFRER